MLLGTYSAPILAAFAHLWCRMAPFIFRCPNTGFGVQGWAADEPTDAETFEPVVCALCTRTHMINQQTGKVLGGDEN